VPIAALERLANADAFRPSLALGRRDAVRAIRALRDRPLPLFEAARTRAGPPLPEISEPAIILRPMTAGREVVEDYNATGLTLRRHPVSFLRRDLASRGIVACAEAANARDGKRLTTSGLVLVRQRPSSARGVVSLTIEDETGIANIVVWPDLFETQRRVVLSAGMLAIAGRVQREGEVVHVVARTLTDLSPLLRSVGERDGAAPPQGHGGRTGQIGRPDKQPRPHIRVRPRDFR
jgi:error-prone DNA polymerase